MVEQPVGLTVEKAVVSTPVRITAHLVSSTTVAPILLQGIIPPPQPGSSLFNPAVARPVFGFSMPMNNR